MMKNHLREGFSQSSEQLFKARSKTKGKEFDAGKRIALSMKRNVKLSPTDRSTIAQRLYAYIDLRQLTNKQLGNAYAQILPSSNRERFVQDMQRTTLPTDGEENKSCRIKKRKRNLLAHTPHYLEVMEAIAEITLETLEALVYNFVRGTDLDPVEREDLSRLDIVAHVIYKCVRELDGRQRILEQFHELKHLSEKTIDDDLYPSSFDDNSEKDKFPTTIEKSWHEVIPYVPHVFLGIAEDSYNIDGYGDWPFWPPFEEYWYSEGKRVKLVDSPSYPYPYWISNILYPNIYGKPISDDGGSQEHALKHYAEKEVQWKSRLREILLSNIELPIKVEWTDAKKPILPSGMPVSSLVEDLRKSRYRAWDEFFGKVIYYEDVVDPAIDIKESDNEAILDFLKYYPSLHWIIVYPSKDGRSVIPYHAETYPYGGDQGFLHLTEIDSGYLENIESDRIGLLNNEETTLYDAIDSCVRMNAGKYLFDSLLETSILMPHNPVVEKERKRQTEYAALRKFLSH